MASERKVTPQERRSSLLMRFLQATQPLSSDEIFATVDGYRGEGRSASLEKQLERDRQLLAADGIEFETVTDPTAPGDRSRWRFRLAHSDAGGRTLELSAIESLLVAQATNIWERSDLADDARRAYLKLAPAGEVDEGVRATVRRATITVDSAFSALHRAIVERRTVEFDYARAGEQHFERRHVDPLQLVTVDGRWLCNTYDLDRGAERNFLLRRIHGEVVDAGPRRSDAEAGTDLPRTLAALAARTPVRVAVEPASDAELRLRRRAVAEHGTDGGWPVLELVDWDHELLADELTSLGGEVRILAPAELVDRVRDRFERIIAQHEEPR